VSWRPVPTTMSVQSGLHRKCDLILLQNLP
jgi:hypothetical protein